jgi:hypothetical protein
MSQGLDGVRQAAKGQKQKSFTALLHHLSVGLLRDSFYALQRKASPGVDGITWQGYETGLEDRLIDLHSRVHRGAYRARPSRRVFIPKDKIVQQAVVTILNQIYEVDFIETVLREFPEVATVFSRTGSPEVATDPMAIDQSDVYVTLKPKDQWPTKRNKDDLIGAMQKRLEEEAPGAVYSFSQPIQMRMQELMEGGSRSDIAIKLFGEDLDTLRQKARPDCGGG